MKQKTRDMTLDEIKGELRFLGFTYSDVDDKFNLPEATANKASRYPHKKGEEAIAATLNLEACQIWPSRYTSCGIRFKPQPKTNYTGKMLLRKEQKDRAA